VSEEVKNLSAEHRIHGMLQSGQLSSEITALAESAEALEPSNSYRHSRHYT
jgi:hypothetical protein